VSIQQNDVIKIAHLARLQIADDEIAGYTVKLSKVITLLEEMNQINTDGILPMAHPFDHAQRLREDKVTERSWFILGSPSYRVMIEINECKHA